LNCAAHHVDKALMVSKLTVLMALVQTSTSHLPMSLVLILQNGAVPSSYFQ
jgi:hypothetical protein